MFLLVLTPAIFMSVTVFLAIIVADPSALFLGRSVLEEGEKKQAKKHQTDDYLKLILDAAC